MPSTTFNTDSGRTIAREQLVLYLNTGTDASPTWSAIGKRVDDSSMDYDWGDDTTQDILGRTYTTLKKPTLTQSFDPVKLDSADAAYTYIWNLAVHDQDAQALASQDLLLVHLYAGSDTKPFAERYPESAIKVTGLGGEGGGDISMPFDVTFGGERAVGTASISAAGVVTFTAGNSSSNS